MKELETAVLVLEGVGPYGGRVHTKVEVLS